jgi:UDP-xylose/UDP-N-acetylglucosamine transporter B4
MENSLLRRKNAHVSRMPNDTVDESENAAVKASGMNLADIVAISCAAMMSWGWTMTLIFGGCCSNVFTLETIVKDEPESGLLITLVQFAVTALFTLHGHVSWKYPFIKPLAIPFSRWIPQILLYFLVSMMNNFVFGYKISVPVHIILRSGGSVTTMVVGWIWGKKYSRGQIVGVMMLTVGVVIAAMADAQAKVFAIC